MKIVVGVLIAIIILIGGYFAYKNYSANNKAALDNQASQANGAVDADRRESSSSSNGFQATGKQLATNYYVFNQQDYEAAKAANRPIYLFFYANWCPTCAKQEPQNVAMFNDLGSQTKYGSLVAFRVNFNDSDTDADEEALAKEFGVTYQHTMFVLDKTGQQTKKFLGQTSTQQHQSAFDAVI